MRPVATFWQQFKPDLSAHSKLKIVWDIARHSLIYRTTVPALRQLGGITSPYIAPFRQKQCALNVGA